MASPVGEDNWLDYVEQNSRGASAKGLEAKVGVIEDFERAISVEAGSLKVWMAYCEYFWSLYADCQPGSDAGWPADEALLGRETFSLDAALSLWQRGYEAVQYRLADSHELWNRWIELEMELLARTRTDNGVRRITQLFRNRLEVPHAAWDRTSQMFSSFLSEYSRKSYETEMEQATKRAAGAKRIYEARDPHEMKLVQAAKVDNPDALKEAWSEYLDWEIRQKNKKDGLAQFKICIGLFARALTGPLALDEPTWLNYVVFISSAHSEQKTGRAKLTIPQDVLPNMLDVLQRAIRHIPWSGTIWARYILTAEEAGLSFGDIERIKHAATSCSHLDRDGMSAVLEMYSAWCGYLKRTAMDPNASEESIDLAEVGLPSALEDVRHWGKRRYGDAYQGDPNFRLEKILIQFLTEQQEDVDAARAVWNQLSAIELHANSYDFWLHWYVWEIAVFASSKGKVRSPTPAAPGVRIPSLATQVFLKALKVRTLDWPERIMEVYLQHCNDYELPNTLREALDTVYKTRKGVAKRREREAREAAQLQAARQTQHSPDQIMEDASDTPSSKRKREPAAEEEVDTGAKRVKSDAAETSDPKRDRENTSVFVTNLPQDATQTKVRQFFREYGHINNIDMQKEEGISPVVLIEFRSPEDAQSALLRDNKYFGEHVIRVSPATDCTLFVTNYPPQADDVFLRDIFQDAGEIHSIRFPSLKYNTKRRFCYVTFRDRNGAAEATKLDGKRLENGKYVLQVKLSDPSAKQQRHGAQAEQRELHVRNLHKDADEQDIKEIFSKAGEVESVRILRNMAGHSHGVAFVVMRTKEQADQAIASIDKQSYRNHILSVENSAENNRKITATSRGGPAAPASPSPAPGGAEGSDERPGADGSTPAEISARTVAVLGVPDTMNDARLRVVLEPLGEIKKLVLHPSHGGAVIEFADANTAGKAALAIEGMEVESGRKLRTGTVAEIFKQKGEHRVDRVDQPVKENSKDKAKDTARALMPPPPTVRRPVLGGSGGRGGRRGLGFVNAVSKAPNGTGAVPAGAKSNDDFKKMFLSGSQESKE
ncbi:hypothetical protein GQ53DRAFT_268853 [Thozetella sp. PMI_491]|nr:hypothetical protein GQ53DRAFT_268853 [Thozetella sp. PMI_491]